MVVVKLGVWVKILMVVLNRVHKPRLVALNQIVRVLVTHLEGHTLEVVIPLVTVGMRVHPGLRMYGVVIIQEVKLVVVVKVVVVVVGITVLVVQVIEIV
jgi:hypothetical protein